MNRRRPFSTITYLLRANHSLGWDVLTHQLHAVLSMMEGGSQECSVLSTFSF